MRERRETLKAIHETACTEEPPPGRLCAAAVFAQVPWLCHVSVLPLALSLLVLWPKVWCWLSCGLQLHLEIILCNAYIVTLPYSGEDAPANCFCALGGSESFRGKRHFHACICVCLYGVLQEAIVGSSVPSSAPPFPSFPFRDILPCACLP